MKDGTKTVFLVIGALLIILGLFMLIPYLVEITIGDKSHNFLFWSFFSIFIGFLLLITNQTEEKSLNIKQAFMMTSLPKPMRWLKAYKHVPMLPTFLLPPTMSVRCLASSS